MAVEGGTVSRYYILVIRKFIDFCRFSGIVCSFLFLLNNFPLQSLEYATNSSVYLLRTAEELSSVLLQTLGKLKSLSGTELSVVVVICLLESFEFELWIQGVDSSK